MHLPHRCQCLLLRQRGGAGLEAESLATDTDGATRDDDNVVACVPLSLVYHSLVTWMHTHCFEVLDDLAEADQAAEVEGVALGAQQAGRAHLDDLCDVCDAAMV